MNLIVYGTRPEEIKLYPFTKYPGFEFLQVDQSKDLHQGLILPNHNCSESELPYFIQSFPPDTRVIVQGDTRTAFRAALAAFESKMPVIHVEAGMRTWDLNAPFPEEGYRRMIDEISSEKFCSTPEATKNCKGRYVGQTGVDTLFEIMEEEGVALSEGVYDLITFHRKEGLERAQSWAEMVNREAQAPLFLQHPNQTSAEFASHYNGEVRQAVPYREMVKLLAGCRRVFTDSGGVQEDALALGKKVVLLRDQSERGHGEAYKPGATKKIVACLRASSF